MLSIPPRIPSRAVLAVLACTAGLLVSCRPPARPVRPNVVLVSIDSLRFDHLGCYGYPKPTSPAIDALAARGVRFTIAHSSTTWTLPAHLALLTGLPDELHEVVMETIALDPSRVLLAECFQAAGYRTAGFFGGPYLHPDFGFGRGFETYENCGVPSHSDLERPGLTDDERVLLQARAFAAADAVRTAERIEERAGAFLAGAGDAPFFLFLHHWDVHHDYLPPAELIPRFAGSEAVPFDLSGYMADEEREPLDAGRLAWLIACYDAEIAHVDRSLERLLERIDALGLGDRTYVVVTADHGEAFFEHGKKGHRHDLHEETLRIPLIVAGPGLTPAVVDRRARLIDVMPTLLDLAGLQAVQDVHGVSLRPLLEGEDPPHLRDLPLLAELTTVTDPRWFDKRLAVGRGGWKLHHLEVHDFDPARPNDLSGVLRSAPPPRLFDLATDPRETVDLALVRPDAFAAERELLARLLDGLRVKWQSMSHRGAAPPVELDPELRRQLTELGYLARTQGQRPPAAPPRRRS